MYVKNLFKDDRRETILSSSEKDIDIHTENLKEIFAPNIQENVKIYIINYFNEYVKKNQIYTSGTFKI